jgi:hypothetical protein
VRGSSHTHNVEERVDATLERGEAEFAREPIDRALEAPPDVRVEGDFTIVDVLVPPLNLAGPFGRTLRS